MSLKQLLTFADNVCYEKTVTLLLLYTEAKMWQFFRNRRYITEISKRLGFYTKNLKINLLWVASIARLICTLRIDLKGTL